MRLDRGFSSNAEDLAAFAIELRFAISVIHREPVLELIGVDPYRFAEIRSLGLINETIDWKQRFFVPSDEEVGIAVLTELLVRYPVMVSDGLTDEEPTEIAPPAELASPQIVNLDEWFVPIATAQPTSESESSLATIAKALKRPNPLLHYAPFTLGDVQMFSER